MHVSTVQHNTHTYSILISYRNRDLIQIKEKFLRYSRRQKITAYRQQNFKSGSKFIPTNVWFSFFILLTAMAFYVTRLPNTILNLDSFQSLSSKHVIKKRKVPLKDELEFYRTINEVKPEILEILMENFTGETYAPPSPPNNHCCLNGGTCFVPTNGNLSNLI